MNTPDLYGAWLTAGDNLQPIVGWIGAHWWLIPVLAAAAFAAWAIGRELRDANRKIDAALAELDHDNDQHRKETP